MLWLFLALAFGSPIDGCVAQATALPTPPDPRLHEEVVVVQKANRTLALYRGGVVQGCWRVALASGYVDGHKVRRGDLRTPEGWYWTSDKPWSSFDHAIAVHYPARQDAVRGLRDGLIDAAQHDAIIAALDAGRKPPQDTRLGGEILIHGGGGRVDWTLGCVAMDNPDLLALRAELPTSLRFRLLILP